MVRRQQLVLLFTLFAARAAFAQFPHPEHVVLVIEENKSFDNVIGSNDAPYLNAMVGRGALLTRYYALHHPSQPNYIDLFAGSSLGVCTDFCPTRRLGEDNLAASLLAAGKTFTGYAEDLPANNACERGLYVRRHCPWADFPGVAKTGKSFADFPSDFAKLPSVAIVIPNVINDMHNGSDVAVEVRSGDRWLQKNLDPYAEWAVGHDSLLIVTWDEDSSSYHPVLGCWSGITTRPPMNRVATLIVGAQVKPGSKSDHVYTHRSLLRTIEEMEGLAPLGGSAKSEAISGIWK